MCYARVAGAIPTTGRGCATPRDACTTVPARPTNRLPSTQTRMVSLRAPYVLGADGVLAITIYQDILVGAIVDQSADW